MPKRTGLLHWERSRGTVRAARLIITSVLETVESFARSGTPATQAYAGLQDDISRFTKKPSSADTPRGATSAHKDLRHTRLFTSYRSKTPPRRPEVLR